MYFTKYKVQFFNRFNAREFATLIIDVLSEAKRRQAGIPSPLTTPKDKGNEWEYCLDYFI